MRELSLKNNESRAPVDWRDASLCIMLLLLTFFFWKIYVGPKLTMAPNVNLRTVDMFLYFYPKFIYGNEILQQGHFPLWNPYEYCGIPFAATYQPEVFYPIKYLIFLFFSPATAMQVFIIFHMFLIGAFSYIFLRVMGLCKSASFLASLLWAFPHDFLYHPTRLASMAWIPFCLICLHMLLSRRTLLWSFLLALGVSLQFFAGTPQGFISNAVFLILLYAVFLTRALRNWDRTTLRSLRKAHILLLIAAGVCTFMIAVQLLPLYEMLHLSHRAEGIDAVQPKFAWQFHAEQGPIQSLGQMFTPLLPSGIPMWAFHLRIILLALSLLGIALSKKPIKVFFILGWGFIALTLYVRPFQELLHRFPPFSYNRFPVVWFWFWPFFTGGLAGLGLTHLEESQKISLKDLIGSMREHSLKRENLSLLIPFLLSIYALLISPHMRYVDLILILLICLSMVISIYFNNKWVKIFSSALIITICLLLFAEGKRHIEDKYRPPQADLEELERSPLNRSANVFLETHKFSRVYSVDVLNHGKQLFSKIGLINGYEASLMTRRMFGISEFYDYGWRADGYRENWDNFVAKPALLNLMGMGLILVPQRITSLFLQEPEQFEVLYENNEHAAFVNKRAMPRCFLVHNARIMKNEEMIFEKLRDGEIDLSREVILEEELPEKFVLEEPPETEPAPEIREYKPEEVIIEAEPQAGGFLLLHDSFYPGWKAYDNGKESRIYLANYLFRGVYLTPGKHTVKFSYEPASFKWGLRLSIVGSVVAIGFFLYKAALLITQNYRQNGIDKTAKNDG